MTEQNRRYAGIALALALAAGVGFGAARLTGPTPAPVEEDASANTGDPDSIAITDQGIATSEIKVAPVEAGGLDAAVFAAATVEATPDAEAVLTPRADGTVVRIFKRIGDPVRAGEALALVESRDASSIAADRDASGARVALASRNLARERSLLAQGVSARADYEAAEAALAVAQADARRASGAAGAVRLAGDGRSIVVVSPVTGRVTAAPAKLGQFVSAEAELFRVADPRRMQVTASLPASDAGRVRSGDRVILVTSDDREVEGRVRSATGVIDPATRAATVAIEPVASGALVPGQQVQARIMASGGSVTAGTVLVLQDAVQTLGDRTVVFVRTTKGFRAQTVQTGGRSGGFVAITGGLKPGMLIAATNAFLLKAELGKESAE